MRREENPKYRTSERECSPVTDEEHNEHYSDSSLVMFGELEPSTNERNTTFFSFLSFSRHFCSVVSVSCIKSFFVSKVHIQTPRASPSRSYNKRIGAELVSMQSKRRIDGLVMIAEKVNCVNKASSAEDSLSGLSFGDSFREPIRFYLPSLSISVSPRNYIPPLRSLFTSFDLLLACSYSSFYFRLPAF